MYEMFSKVFDSEAEFWASIAGTCWVRQIKLPRAHNSESSSTERLPDTVICPLCSFNLSPMTVKLSPNNFKYAATSIGCSSIALKIFISLIGSLAESFPLKTSLFDDFLFESVKWTISAFFFGEVLFGDFVAIN